MSAVAIQSWKERFTVQQVPHGLVLVGGLTATPTGGEGGTRKRGRAGGRTGIANAIPFVRPGAGRRTRSTQRHAVIWLYRTKEKHETQKKAGVPAYLPLTRRLLVKNTEARA